MSPAYNSNSKYDFQKNSKLSVSEAASLLKISPTSLRRFESENRISSSRLENGYRVFDLAQINKLREELEAEKLDKIKKKELKCLEPINRNIEQKNKHNQIKINPIKLQSNLKTTKKLLKEHTRFITSVVLVIALASGMILNPSIKNVNYSKLLTGLRSNRTLPNTVDKVKTSNVLAMGDQRPDYLFNLAVPTNFEKEVSLPTINFSGTGTINQLDAIDDTTETTLENALDLNGEVTSTGLNNTVIADGVIDGNNLTTEFEYDGDFNFAGTWAIDGTEVTATAEELNSIPSIDTTVIDGITTTAGGIYFANGSTLAQDAINLFWNDTSNSLGIGTNTPAYTLDVNGTARFVSDLNITSSANLIFGGSTTLAEFTSATDSGAYNIGVFDEFTNSSSTTVQGVLNDLDTAIGAGSSKFSQDTGFIYLTNTTDEVVLGGIASLNAKLAIDGDSDQTQLLVQSNSTQTSNVATFERSNGNDLLNISADGDITSGFTQLDGSTTANGSGSTTTTLILSSASNFNSGNYVRVDSNNCSGTLNTCYAKIRNIAGNTLTLFNGLSWANGATVTEYHIPEVGGTNTANTLTNRYGQGFFISGTVAGNGSTYYTDGSIFTSDVSGGNSLGLTITTGDTTGSGNSGNITIDTGNAAGTEGIINIGTSNTSAITIGRAGINTEIEGTLVVNNENLTDLTGNGLEITGNSLTIKVAAAADALSNTIASGSGLEVLSSGLTLIQGCSDGQVLKWNETSDSWDCSNDTGATSAVINVENNDVAVGTNVDTLDFGPDFTLTPSPSNEANIAIADDALNFSEFADALVFDANTSLNLYNGSSAVNARFFNSNSSSESLFINGSTGNVGIGNTNPQAKLAVGGTSQFRVDTNGNLTRINDVAYSWPGSQAGADNYVLTNDGAGNLTWESVGSVGGLDGTGIANYLPLWSDSNTLTTSALYQTGGNVGIGTTAPSSLLHVAGTATATTFTDGTASLSAGTLDLGTNTIYDGNLTGNWAFNNGNLSNISAVTATGTVTLSGLGTGTDNTVVILNGSNQLTTDEIDSRVWGTSLVDGTATANYIPYMSDADSLANSNIYYTGGNLGIGTTAPSAKLSIGASSQFRVDTNGNLTRINDVAYSWPGSQALADNYVLTNDGSGNLTWESVGSVGGLDGTGTANYLPLWSDTNTLTSSSLYETGGNIGIGTTAPASKLQIVGTTTSTTFSDGTATLSAGTLDLGTNTIYDGNLTGNWAFNSGNVSGIGTLAATSTVTFSGLGTGTDNTVVILNSSNQLTTDEIDSRVWGTSLVDGTATANYIPYMSDADSLANSNIYYTGGNLGIGTTAPSTTLDVAGGFLLGNGSATGQINTSDWDISTTGNLTGIGAITADGTITLSNLASSSSENTIVVLNSSNQLEQREYSDFIADNNIVDGAGNANYLPLWSDSNTLTDSGIYQTGGNFGIGTTAPASKLQIVGTTTSTTFSDGTATLSAGTLDLGTNTIYDGNLTGNWALNDGNLTGVNSITADNTITFTGLGTGTDNTVVILNGSNQLTTDEIDSRVWGTSLVDGTATANYIPYMSDSDSLANSNLYYSAGALGIGTTAPAATLHIAGSNQAGIRLDAYGASAGNTSELRFQELSTNGSEYTGFKSPDALASSLLYTLPGSSGSSDYVLTWQPGNVLEWKSVSGAGGNSGDITTVGSMTTGDVFMDANADDDWLGLGASAGRIEFDDQSTDEVNILGANLGIGTTAPSALLSVGASSQFRVDTNGNLTRINDVAYSWPGSQALADNYVLTNDGSGNLTWESVSGAGGLDGSGTTNYLPLWSDSNTLTSSALYQTGGNIGIGTTAPSSLLHVAGTATATTFTDGTTTLSAGTLDLGTNTIYDGNLTGNWALNDGNLTGVNSITADNTITFTGLGTGTDNTVVILNSSNQLTTDEIDSRVWGTSLVDGSATANYIPYMSDADSLANSNIYYTGGNLGIGTTAPSYKLTISGGDLALDNNEDIYWGSGVTQSYLNVNSGYYNFYYAGSKGLELNLNASSATSVTSYQGDFIIDNDATDEDILLKVNDGGVDTTAILVQGSTGYVGIGTTNPSAKLSVGASSQFRVDTNGNLTRINDVAYSWPGSQALADNYVLTNDGSGNLTWESVGSVGGLDGTGTANYLPLWSDTNTLTSSSLYETGGNIGIGTTAPASKLQIVGTTTSTTFSDGTATLSAGTLDLGTNTIYDGNLTGNWALNDGNLTGVNSITADNTITFTGLGTGTDNTVVILNGSNQLTTDEIDSRVWGTSLVDGSGLANYVARFSDTDTLTTGTLYDTGTNVGIGTTAPSTTLDVAGGFLLGNGSATGQINTSDWDISTTGDLTGIGAITADGTITATGLGTGTDNTVVILNSSNQLTTDEIDSRVWGTSLVDGTATANYIPYMSDADSLANSNIYYTGGNIGIGTTAPSQLFSVAKSGAADIAIFTTDTPGGGTSGAGLKVSALWEGRPALIPTYANGSAGTTLVLLGAAGQQVHLVNSNRVINTLATGASGSGSYIGLNATNGTIIGGIAPTTSVTTLELTSVSGQTGDLLNITSYGGTYGDLLTIDSSGNMGIGTTNPGSKLQVAGSITPTTNNSYDLGTAALQWNDLFIGGNLDLGTNTIYDGNLTGNWALNDGNLTGVNSITADNTITFTGLGTGTDNTVVILNSSNQLTTDEIDSRVWGTSLVDGTATANYLPYMSDSDSLANSSIYYTGGNLGIGTTAPSTTLDVAGGFLLGNGSATGQINTSDWDISTTGDLTGIGAITADGTITATGLGTGTDNTVVILNSSNQLTTDEIDSRVWGTSLVDGSATANYIPYMSDADSLANSNIYYTGGNLGIGTTNPGAPLEIYSASTNGILNIKRGYAQIGATSVDLAAINFGAIETNVGQDGSNAAAGIIKVNNDLGWSSAATPSHMSFWTTPSGSTTATEKLRITAAGYVGIGTTAPSTTLDVAGGFLLGNGSATGQINTSDWDISTTGDLTGIGAITADGTITATGLGTGTDNTVVILNSSNQLTTDEIDSRVWGTSLVDGTATANYIPYMSDADSIANSAIYQSSSNIGIGTTAPLYNLELSSATTTSYLGLAGYGFSNYTDISGLIFKNNYTTSGTKELAAIVMGLPTSGNLGNLHFRTKPNASDSSLTTAMTLTYAGNLGIGTTAPSTKLDVAGGFLLGNGSATGEINTSDWDISTTGIMTGMGNIFSDGFINTNSGGIFSAPTAGNSGKGIASTTTGMSLFHWNGDVSLRPGNSGTFTTALTALSSGYVGIGTTAPSTTLDVAGGFLLGNGSATGQINTSDWDISTTGDLTGIGAITADGTYTASTGTSNAIALTRSSAGQWISFTDGTDSWGLYNYAGSPESNLAANTGALAMDTTNGTLYVKTDDTDNTGWVNLATGGSSQWTDAGTYIYANNATSTVVNDSGYIGIGTTNPTYALDVVGDINLAAGNQVSIGGTNVINLSTTADYAWFFGNGGASHGANDDYNLSLGYNALAGLNNTGGLYNIGIGYNALNALTSGDRNIAMGYGSLATVSTGTDSVAIGHNALNLSTDSYNVAIGSGAADILAGGTRNVAIGYDALGGSSSASYSVVIGFWAGDAAMTGNSNTIIGNEAGTNVTSGNTNTIVGANAGSNLQTGYSNTIIGSYAGNGAITGNNNLILGYSVGSSAISGTNNVFLGATNQSITSGSHNYILGDSAGRGVTTGSYNFIAGNAAAYDATNTLVSDDNLIIGRDAAYILGSDANDNIVLGRSAGRNINGADNNIYLGYGAGYNETGSNKLYIDTGGTAITQSTALIYGDFSANTLTFNGNVGIGTTNPQEELDINGQVYLADGSAPVSTTNKLYSVSGNLFWNGTQLNSSGSIDGSGTANYVAKFSDSNTLTTGVLVDTGSAIGIGTTAPSGELQIAGTTPQIWLGDGGAEDTSLVFDGNAQDFYFALSDTLDDLVLGTGSTIGTNAIFTIENGGNIGIGTTAPSAALHVLDTTEQLRLGYDVSNYVSFTINSSGVLTIGESGTDIATFSETQINFDAPTTFNATGDVSIANDIQFTNQTSAYIKSDGPLEIQSGEIFENNNLVLTTYGTGNIVANLGAGTTNPNALIPGTDNVHDLGNASYRWNDVYATNATIQTSDERLKENVTDINYGLNEILQLRPVTYTWIDKPAEGTKLGLIAQETYNILPEVVNVPAPEEGGYWGLRYTDLLPVVIKAIQEQNATITNIQAQLGIETTNENNTDIIEQASTIYNNITELVTQLGLSVHTDAEGNNSLAVNSDMNVLGSTTLQDLTVTGDAQLGLIKISTIESSISTIAKDQTLYLQNYALAGGVDIFNGKILLNNDGSIEATKVTTEEVAIKSSGNTIGTATIEQGNKHITIDTVKVSDDSKIFITATSNTYGEQLYISDKVTGESFEVSINNTVQEDITFDWWIVNIE